MSTVLRIILYANAYYNEDVGQKTEGAMDINKKILDLCHARGWSLYVLAEQAGLTQSTLNSAFVRNTPPKIDTLSAICDALGMTLSQFFLEDEETEVLTADEKAMLAAYRRLSPEKQEALRVLLSR